jgi:O-antigen/teichoic acid export membrane protein
MLFGRRYAWLRPKLGNVTGEAVSRVFRLGMLFLVLQVAVAVAYSSDNIIVAQVLGAEAVTEYSVPMKLFSIPALVLAVLLIPLWPAYGESVARGWERFQRGEVLS